MSFNSLKRLFFFAFFFVSRLLHAQTDSTKATYIYIETITVEGNKKTKTPFILRELAFKIGDSIALADVGTTLEVNRLRLMNRGIYISAKLNVKTWNANNRVSIHIVVKESWYIWPIPVFELADRNYNVWWKEQNHSLKRTLYGIDLQHNNLTGRGDRAKMGIYLGYARKFDIDYKILGIDKKQKFGLGFNLLYRIQKEIGYTTENNKLIFKFDPDEYLLRRFRAIVSITYRPRLFTLQTLGIERYQTKISSGVANILNPNFFLDSKDFQKHWSLAYKIEHDRRDIRPYPLHGWFGSLEFRQNGLLNDDNLRFFSAKGRLEKYVSFSSKISLETIFSGRYTVSKGTIPYFNNQALGYERDFVRGFEYYVVDGKDFAYTKSSLHLQVLKRNFSLKYMPLKSFQNIPLTVFFSINNDLGYVNEPTYIATNFLNNRLLWGTGIGLNFVAYYSRVFILEWSRNDLGEKGLFFKMKITE
jgi:outer membrane protein assembly factor BamA